MSYPRVPAWDCLRPFISGLTAAALIGVGTVAAQTNSEEEFTDEDFAQFFGLLVDGKISRQKLDARCAGKSLGFTFAAADFVQQGPPQRRCNPRTQLADRMDTPRLGRGLHLVVFRSPATRSAG